jgi:hypothetical protein
MGDGKERLGSMKRGLVSQILWVGAAGFVVMMIALILGPGSLLGFFLIFGSQRTIFERALSPDALHEARVQFDDAGALSTFDRMVFLKSRWNPSDAPLLSCRAFWAEGVGIVHLRWLNRHELLIQHDFPPRAVKAVSAGCGSIQIATRSLQLDH